MSTQRLDVPEAFSTARLRLRRPSPADADAIFRTYAADADVTRYLTWRAHPHVEQTAAYVRRCLDDWTAEAAFTFVIELSTDQPSLIGMIGFQAQGHRLDFGYVLGRQFWNRGYVSEALGHLVDWSLAQTPIFRAAAYCDVDNVASARVMDKVGMTFEGRIARYAVRPNLSDAPRDALLYAKTR